MRKLREFIKNQRGAVFIIVAMCFVSMTGIVATSIDYARGALLKSELISALDSAALAGGTVANSSGLNAMATKYYNVNLPNGYLTSTVDPVTTTLAADKTTVTVAGSAHLKNSMMQIVNWNMANVAATSEVTLERRGMELVLVLDNTGSMNSTDGTSTSRLAALKTASTTLINILYGSKTTIPDLWVGLVPFSQAVNIGATRTAWVTTTAYNWGPAGNSWGGCVEARETSNRDVTDDPPATALFPKYYSPCVVSNSSSPSWWNSWYGTNISTTPPSYSNCATTASRQYRTPFSVNLGPNQYCAQALTQMQADKTTVISGINSMSAGGDTEINLGLVWGWRMLSPRWRTLWGGQMNTDSLPLNYNTPLMNKVVILLTDGDNQFSAGNYTAYGQLSAGRLGTTNSTTAGVTLDNRTLQVCSSMKANNILIYTIALGGSITTTGKNLLKSCASKPEYYFESPTGNDLQSAFTTIADSLSNLRISK